MITNETADAVRGWFTGRLPEEWVVAPPSVTLDRDEVVVLLPIAEADLAEGAGDAEVEQARAGRARAFREDTRERRMAIAREAQHRFGRTVSWGVVVGDRTELFTHLAAPVMSRLRQPQRIVLDTLVDAGVARSRSDALAWCVRLVEQHEDDWLNDLRTAVTTVEEVRRSGPAA